MKSNQGRNRSSLSDEVERLHTAAKHGGGRHSIRWYNAAAMLIETKQKLQSRQVQGFQVLIQ